MRISSAAKLALSFALASLVPFVHSQVVAQADDIPDTVLVTGSLLRGVAAQTDPGQLTELTDDELRTQSTKLKAYVDRPRVLPKGGLEALLFNEAWDASPEDNRVFADVGLVERLLQHVEENTQFNIAARIRTYEADKCPDWVRSRPSRDVEAVSAFGR